METEKVYSVEQPDTVIILEQPVFEVYLRLTEELQEKLSSQYCSKKVQDSYSKPLVKSYIEYTLNYLSRLTPVRSYVEVFDDSFSICVDDMSLLKSFSIEIMLCNMTETDFAKVPVMYTATYTSGVGRELVINSYKQSDGGYFQNAVLKGATTLNSFNYKDRDLTGAKTLGDSDPDLKSNFPDGSGVIGSIADFRWL